MRYLMKATETFEFESDFFYYIDSNIDEYTMNEVVDNAKLIINGDYDEVDEDYQKYCDYDGEYVSELIEQIIKDLGYTYDNPSSIETIIIEY